MGREVGALATPRYSPPPARFLKQIKKNGLTGSYLRHVS